MTELAEELKKLRYGLVGGATDDDFVARVMDRCRSEAPAPTPWRRLARAHGGALGAVAAVAAATVVLLSWPPRARDVEAPPSTVAARGDGRGGMRATVQAFVAHAGASAAPPLLDGATLRPGDGIVVRYSNPTAEQGYLMVFGLDERGTVHWLHPAYLDESSNPRSLPLVSGAEQQVLPEVAEPEDAAAGLLRVYALISRTALDVKSVERRLAENRDVAESFPEAEVEEWRCTWMP
jgi:hypothetical protein